MKITIKIFSLFILLTASHSFSQVKSIDSERLVKMLEGSYSSEEQANADSDFLDIRLHMKRIWSEREDAKWLYAEQSAANDENNPSAQRVYKITNTYEGRFQIDEFVFNDPLRFAGDWKREVSLSSLTPDSLKLIEGCAVIVTLMNDGGYEGGTRGKKCKNELNGAMYSDSDVKFSDDAIITWKRGFDENDKQVWGPIKGGYVFKKVK